MGEQLRHRRAAGRRPDLHPTVGHQPQQVHHDGVVSVPGIEQRVEHAAVRSVRHVPHLVSRMILPQLGPGPSTYTAPMRTPASFGRALLAGLVLCCRHPHRGSADAGRQARHPGEVHPADHRLRLRQARRDDPDARRGQALHGDRRAQGRQERADHHDPHALQRRRARHARAIGVDAGHAAAGRRGVRRRRLHPRLPGRARQVRLRGRLPDDPSAARAAQPDHHRSFHRRLRHHRVAGEERPRVQRPRRHAGQLVRRASRW